MFALLLSVVMGVFELSLLVSESVEVETDVLSDSEEVCSVDPVFELVSIVVVSLELELDELEEEDDEEKDAESEFPETLLIFTGVLSVEPLLTDCEL